MGSIFNSPLGVAVAHRLTAGWPFYIIKEKNQLNSIELKGWEKNYYVINLV